MRRHGLTKKGLGVTAHGLRNENLTALYTRLTGMEVPVRGGVRPEGEAKEMDIAGRLEVARTAGHCRIEISNAYIGGRKPRPPVSIEEIKGAMTCLTVDNASARARSGSGGDEPPR